MARKVRVQYPGAIYHVMNRGDHSEAVFRDRQDSDLFLTDAWGSERKNRLAGA
jgi:putative transposase